MDIFLKSVTRISSYNEYITFLTLVNFGLPMHSTVMDGLDNHGS